MAKRKVNKAAFIMSFPLDTPTKKIVELGKAKGIAFSTNYVSRIRSLNAAKKGAPAKRGPGRPPGSKNKAKAAFAASRGGGSAESAFKRLVLDLGIGRARGLLAEVEQALAKLIG